MVASAPPRRLFVLLLTLCGLLAGCTTAEEGPPATEDAWSLDVKGSSWEGHGRIRFVETAEAIGPDLAVHPADIYEVSTYRAYDGKPLNLTWRVGVDPGSGRILSMMNLCPSVDPGTLRCQADASVHVSTSEQTLFFGAPLVLPHLPASGGEFALPVWSAGRTVEVPFEVRIEEGTTLVTAERRVEHTDLDAPGSSNGDILSCDVFEGDILLVEDERIGCREREEGWTWWVPRPIPSLPDGRFGPFPPPLQTTDAGPHHVPPGTTGLPFPLPRALEAIQEEDAEAREVLRTSDWRPTRLIFRHVSSASNPATTCETWAWDVTLIAESGTWDAASASQRSCDVSALDETQVEQDPGGTAGPWLAQNSSISWPAALTLSDRAVCYHEPNRSPAFQWYVREVTHETRGWLTVGRATLNWGVFDTVHGYLLEIHKNPSDGRIGRIFEDGIPKTCDRYAGEV